MSSIEPARSGGSLKRRVVPSAVAFVVVAIGVYATVWLALGLLRHIVIPVLAVVTAGWVASRVYKLTGRSAERHQRDRS